MSLERPCIHWNDGYCNKFSDGEVESWCVDGPCKYEQPSNADRIRAMSDEELAELLCGELGELGYCKNLPECGELLDTVEGIPEEKCIGCALAWLR